MDPTKRVGSSDDREQLMPVCDEGRFVYVHIPKCAGKSITNALKRSGATLTYVGQSTPHEREPAETKPVWLHHLKAGELRERLGAERWAAYYKFAFVRNPWDLLVSYYHYHRIEAVASEEFRRSWPGIAARFTTCVDFASWIRSGIYVEPQSTFLTTTDGAVIVDFIGRFETLELDFATVSRRIGGGTPLRHLNSTVHTGYQDYYDAESRAIVARHFATDITQFGYTFEPPPDNG